MIVDVLVELSNRNVDKTFSYSVPSTLKDKIKVGIRVLVPFGKQTLEGFILNIKDTVDEDLELKEIIEVIDDEIILDKELLELGKYISESTLSTLISSYQVMLPKALKAKEGVNINKKIETYIVLEKEPSNKLTIAQSKIIDKLKMDPKIPKSKLNKISLSAVKTRCH